MKFRLLHALVCAAAVGASACAAAQGAYPSQPVRLIVPFAPGGSTDVLARAVAEGMRKELGQSVVVENRAGAGGLLGTEAVARAEPDGYTLGMATVSTMAVNPLLYGTRRVDPATQLKPVAQVATVPVVWMVNPSFPAQDFAQFLAELRANPGKYSYGSPGVGSLGHLNLAAMNASLKVEVLHVPYRGMGPALTAAVGGEVQVQQDQYASAQSLIKAGKLRAIAVSAPARLAATQKPLYRFLLNKWYFDELYDFLFVRPARWLGRLFWKGGDGWLIDGFGPDGISARVLDVTNRVVKMQSGYLYHYAFAMLIGVAALVTWMMLGSSF